MRKLLFGAAAVLLGSAIALTSGDAHATTFKELTSDQRVDLADLIIRGTVTEVWTERDDRGVIWTRAQVDVSSVIKGNQDADALIIDQLGGEWGGVRMSVGGAARFSQGEEGLFFIAENNGKTRFLLQSMGLGKWTIRIDPHSGREIVQQFMAPLNEDYDHRFIPAPAKEDRVFLSSFEERIQTRLAQPSVEVK
jgi:hypothetical protein